MARSLYEREARRELAAAYEAAIAAVNRADAQGKRQVGIQWMKAPPYYRLLAISESQAHKMQRTCYRFDGFTLEIWADNLLYAMEAAGCFQYATRDDIDAFELGGWGRPAPFPPHTISEEEWEYADYWYDGRADRLA